MSDTILGLTKPVQPGASPRKAAILVFALLTGLSVVSGVAVRQYRNSRARVLLARAADDMKTVAEFQARAVEREVEDHLRDASVVSKNPFFLRNVAVYLRTGEYADEVEEWLKELRDTERYEIASLADAAGVIRLSTARPTAPHVGPDLQSIWEEALHRAQPTLSPPHRYAPGRPVHSDIVAPLRAGGALMGAVVFRMSLAEDRGWLTFLPGGAGATESELLWREGDTATVVAPSAARAAADTVETAAVLSDSGPLRGLDAKGVDVVGASARVGQTGLVLLVKTPESELLKPLAAQTRFATLSAVLASACVLLGVVAMRRRQRERRLRDLYRRQSEEQEALAASERHFRELVESIPGGVWICDAAGSLTYISPQIESKLALPLERALADGWTSVIHPDDRESCQQAFARAVAERKPFEAVFRAAAADCVELTLLGRGTPRFSRSGEFQGLVGNILNITERQRAEQRIRQLSAAVEQSPAVVFMTNIEGFIEYVNPRFTEVTGYTAEEAIGRTPAILKSGRTPVETYRAMWETILSGGGWRGEMLNRKKSGETFWARCSISPIRSPEGTITRFVATQEDITALQRAEEEARRSADQIRRIVESNLIGTMVFENDTVVEANGEFLRASGYSAEDVRAGLNWRTMTPPEHLPMSEHAHEQLRLTGVVHPFQKEYFRKNGSRFPVLLGGTAISVNPRRDICFVVDLTEVKESEREIQRMNGELRRLSAELLRSEDAERRRIARELHDSTAQLLTGIQFNLRRLESAIAEENGLRPVFDQTAAMARQCTSEIRAISYAMHPPLLDDLGLAPAIDMLGRGFEERTGIQVTTEVDRDLGRLDRDLELALFRIVQEGLTNVQRHSGSRSAAVRLNSRVDGLLLEIEDFGGGAPAGENGGARVGVGLLGMRERAKQFGGEMTLLSTGSGATVRVRMPAAV